MIRLIKPALRKLGLRRYKLEDWHYRLDCHFPTRFLGVWLLKPVIFLHWLKNTTARRTMLCLPDKPNDVGYELVKLAMILGVRLSREAKRPHLAIAWQDTTVRTCSLESAERKTGYVLNGRCQDIGKDRLGRVFESVFGYSLQVDPTTYRGPCVRKSVLNAKHDGVVVNGPINRVEPGCVYQRLVDNQFDDQFVVDLRTPCFGGALPLVYVKYRSLQTRFSDLNDRVEIARTEEIFSREEQEIILRFARAFDLEYGGLDILRDNATRRLYIVDANNTAFGPPKELAPRDKRRALAILAATFQEKFIAGFPRLAQEKTAPIQTLAESRQCPRV